MSHVSALAAMITNLRHLIFCTASVLFLAFSCMACDDPVHEYALKYWEPDPYVVTVLHKGPLTGDGKKAMATLREASGFGEKQANIIITDIDLSSDTDNPTIKKWRKDYENRLPWMIVSYPAASKVSEVAWAGRFEVNAVVEVLTSAARRDITDCLIQGDTIAWVLLESGNEKRDNNAYNSLRDELLRLKKSLKVDFQIFRISRKESNERFLINQLMNCERDLAQYKSDPMVFPIFGRARILYALVGEGINSSTIREAGAYLKGACTCEVKSQNPGLDMLTTMDWVKGLAKAKLMSTAPAPVGMTSFIEKVNDSK